MTRYDDVLSVLLQPEIFSSTAMGAATLPAGGFDWLDSFIVRGPKRLQLALT